MYPLFETIAILNGVPRNLAYHQARYEKSLAQFYGSAKSAVHFEKILQKNTALSGLVRCRVDYNDTEQQVQYFPYQKRIVRTFQPVVCDHIDYSLKFTDRELLNQIFAQRSACDEVIIIKQGYVTDCSIGNLIFKRQGQWFTPQSYLLNGTQRQKLLAENKIHERLISLKEIDLFEEIRLINAMNGLDL